MTSIAVPTAQRTAVKGAEYIASHVAKLKAQNPNHMVVGAGDLIGATPLILTILQRAVVETLNRIGLELSTVGNHELDKGSAATMARSRSTLKPRSSSPTRSARLAELEALPPSGSFKLRGVGHACETHAARGASRLRRCRAASTSSANVD